MTNRKSSWNVLSKCITPTFSQSTSNWCLEATSSSTSSKTIGDAVSILMDDDIVLHRTVAVRVGQVPNEHAAHATPATVLQDKSGAVTRMNGSGYILGRCGEVGIVDAALVMHRYNDTVILLSTFIEIVHLEVEIYFGKAVTVGNVVDSIGNIERINASSILIFLSARIVVVIIRVVEVEAVRSLVDEPPLTLGTVQED